MSPFVGFLFYCFAGVLLASGIGVITMRNPVHCALSLVVSFVSAALLWLLVGAEFLAWVLILVYVGAVMVLFLFVVMMLDINLDRLREGFWSYLPLGLMVSLVLAVQIYLVFNSETFGVAALAAYDVPLSAVVGEDYSHIKEIGAVLYTDYLLPFEVAAVILLVAIVAAIALTMRRRPGNKQIEASVQVEVDPAKQVRMVSVELDQPPPPPPAEPEQDEPERQPETPEQDRK